MMAVFIVREHTDYESIHILEVFSTKKKAEAEVRWLKKNHEAGSFDYVIRIVE